LAYLADYVNLMEVNATFYAPLTARSAQGWVERLEGYPDFRFVIKAWGRLTHDRRFPGAAEVEAWSEVLRPLRDAGRLVCVLAQFPWSVTDGPGSRDRLRAVRDALPDGVPVATEFRHDSWASGDALEWVRREGFAFVNIDQPQGTASLPPTEIVTSDLAYVRLHGRNAAAWFSPDAGRDARYDWRYSSEELEPWTQRIGRLQAQVPLTVVVGNNHFQGKAMATVLELAARLTGDRVHVPEALVTTYPDLETIRRPDPGALF